MSTYEVLKQLQEEGKSSGGNNGGSKSFYEYSASACKWSQKKLIQLYRLGGKSAWIFATTALITILPLILEVEREQSVIEIENLQVQHLKSQGYTQAQLAQMGFRDQSTTLATETPTAMQ